MKIIVNNESERELIQRFVDALHEELLSEIQDSDHKWATENKQEPYLWADEYRFLEESLYRAKVEVDTKETQLEVEDSSIITGECSACGGVTEGTIDGGPVKYEEYLRLTSEESRKSWKCETCWNMNTD